MTLWHITTQAEWTAAKLAGSYRSASFEREGFIHLSTAQQWLRTANRYYRGQAELVRLCVDETKLLGPLRFEPAAAPPGQRAQPSRELFPHLYGPLPLDAVLAVVDLPLAADGSFVAQIPEPHAALVARAIELAMSDPRILGMAAAGSWATGTLDEHSDVDLVVMVTPTSRDALFAERTQLLGALGHVLAAFTGEHLGERRLVVALFGAPLLHVDVKLVTASELAGQGSSMQIVWERDAAMRDALEKPAAQPSLAPWQDIEDKFWIWVHHGATKLARGELLEALDHLGFVRVHALAPLGSYARGEPARGVRFVERDSPLLARRLAETVATLDPVDLRRALGAAVTLYRELRSSAPASLCQRAEAERAAVQYLAKLG